MLNLLAKLQADTDNKVSAFGEYQEEAIISLALDHPEFFSNVSRFLKPDLFARPECQYIIGHILNLVEQFGIVPSRPILKNKVLSELTVDDSYQEVLKVLDRPSDFREVPILKDNLLKWAKQRAYGLLYSDEAMMAFQTGDFDELEKIVNEANKISDIGEGGFWLLQNFEVLFDPTTNKHLTTGFTKLDQYLNNGGPSPKEVCCWLAPTNVGKCLTSDTKIIEKKLSRIYELEMEDGSVIKARGSCKVQTTRGTVNVCDLTSSDELTEIPISEDSWDLEL